MNTGFVKAVGEPGEPGDIQRIIHLSNRIGEAYEQLLDWKLQFLRTSVDDDFVKLMSLASEYSSNAITEMEEFSMNMYSTMEGHIANEHNNKEGTVITLKLTLSSPDTDAFHEELERLTRVYI